MKISKQQRKNHNLAVERLAKDKLTFDDKIFVLENWIPSTKTDIGYTGTFFTPRMMAHDFCFEAGRGKVIDLCAGIGMLSFQLHRFTQGEIDLTCIELNNDFVEVGKKILPEAKWICGDVLNEDLIRSLGKFDNVISNPPFGNIKTGLNHSWLKYKGSEFEYKVIEVGSYLARFRGTFILPQLSCPFKISGSRQNSPVGSIEPSDKYKRFQKETQLSLSENCGFDLSQYSNQWLGTNQLCEFAHCEYEELRKLNIAIEEDVKEFESSLHHVQSCLFDF